MNAIPKISNFAPPARLSLAALTMIVITGAAWAQQGPGGPAGAPGDDQRRPYHGMQGDRPQLLTQEEREQFRNRMHAAKTPEERKAVRDGMRSLVEQRAKEKGVTLPAPRAGRDGERHGMRHGDGRSPHHGERHGVHDGKRHGGDKPQLFSQDERQQFRDKMHAAKTPEERKALRGEMRTLAEQRAKEKGINLQDRRRPGRHRYGPQGESSRG